MIPEDLKVDIRPLCHEHDRGAFTCGVHDIDAYLDAFDVNSKMPSSRIYVATNGDTKILGYYSIRPAIWRVPGLRKKHERDSFELELAMLGVVPELQGQGIVGNALMYDAFQKACHVYQYVGGIERLWVGPLNDKCRPFYQRAGFMGAEGSSRMFVTISEIVDALGY